MSVVEQIWLCDAWIDRLSVLRDAATQTVKNNPDLDPTIRTRVLECRLEVESVLASFIQERDKLRKLVEDEIRRDNSDAIPPTPQ
jgi:hypothetical protein